MALIMEKLQQTRRRNTLLWQMDVRHTKIDAPPQQVNQSWRESRLRPLLPSLAFLGSPNVGETKERLGPIHSSYGQRARLVSLARRGKDKTSLHPAHRANERKKTGAGRGKSFWRGGRVHYLAHLTDEIYELVPRCECRLSSSRMKLFRNEFLATSRSPNPTF
jgi:hypothetical protein